MNTPLKIKITHLISEAGVTKTFKNGHPKTNPNYLVATDVQIGKPGNQKTFRFVRKPFTKDGKIFLKPTSKKFIRRGVRIVSCNVIISIEDWDAQSCSRLPSIEDVWFADVKIDGVRRRVYVPIAI